MQRALIFDCDGVLADTELDGHLVAFNQTFAEFGCGFTWTPQEYRELLKVGGGKERMLAYATQHPELDFLSTEPEAVVRALHKRKSEVYVELVEAGALPPRPGIRRIVHEALDAGWKVAVASTSALDSVTAVLRAATDPADFARVSGIFAGDIVPAKKPAPDIYLLAARELGLSRDGIVVVEDSESGAKAAANAGLRHIVTVSYFTGEDPFPAASTVVSSLGDPQQPAHLLAGADVRDPATSMVTVASLEQILALPAGGQ
ncbi:MAG: HAD-IA family hydrolase [Propionibacteriaceae bacterium]|nr:HAD-IA family hydrolase [Propionibacteriaceae bacterium]